MKPADKTLSFFVRAYWFSYFAAQLFLARVLTIDFYDAFVYLRNARRLAGDQFGFTPDRPPLVPLLHAPLQGLLNFGYAGAPLRIWAPHVFETFISGACLVVVYRFLRRSLSPGWAQLGTIVFSLNRLTIHYFGSVLPDIPATLLLLLVFMLEDEAEKGGGPRAEALTFVALAGCLLCRWNMLLAPAGLALRGCRPYSPPRLRRIARISAASLVLFFAVMVVLYMSLHPMSVRDAGGFVLENLKEQFVGNNKPEPLDAYLHSIAVSFGYLPVLALFYGLGWGRGKSGDGDFAAAFLIFFMAVMTFGVGHKESRYLLPTLPLFCLFIIQGLRRACERAHKIPRAAIVGAALLACVLSAGREFNRFRDPAFRSTVALDAARTLKQRTASARTLYWEGFARSIFPEDPVFARGDPNYYFYHIPNKDCAEYLVSRHFESLRDGPPPAPGDVLVRAPRRLRTLAQALPPEENRLTVLVYGDENDWEPAGSF